ncbi:MAG TPA: tetratricopeptide repeat protein [Dokdonella sp.]|nr:tetratricopeptide repeat protein [Dokdonella sp.]
MKHALRPLQFALPFIFVAGLSACSTQSQPEKAPLTRADPDRAAAVEAIRAASAGEDSALQVNPLRDPAVEGYLAQAREAEKLQQFDAAHEALAKARKLAPDAPDLLQYEAEIEFLRGNTVEAEKLAYQSFKKGPQVGTLCVQNWQTVVEARKIFNDADYRAVAEAKRDQCKVKRPVRL